MMNRLPPPRKACLPPDRPLLRYYGGKWELAPWTISLMPTHRGYCEPFGGAGSVLLQKPRCHTEIYNDLDFEVVNLFQVLRDLPNDLIRVVTNTPVSRKEFECSYEISDDPLERARRLLLRSYFGFSGIATHLHTASFIGGVQLYSGTSCGNQWRSFPESIDRIVDRVRGVVIENRDAFEILKRYDQKDMLFYIDPPYVGSTRGAKSVYKYEMADDKQKELAEILNGLSGMVMVAGYRSELYDQLYQGWRVEERKSLDGKSNRRIECIWMRNIESNQINLL